MLKIKSIPGLYIQHTGTSNNHCRNEPTPYIHDHRCIYTCVYIYLGYLYNMKKEQTVITNCRLVILKTLAYIMIYINFMSVFVLYFTASSSVTTGFCKFYYYFQKQVLYELFSFFDNFSHKKKTFSPWIIIFPIHTVVDFY